MRNGTRANSGMALALVAIMLVSLLGIAGLVVESITAEITKQQCVTIAEQAATAAVKKLSKEKAGHGASEITAHDFNQMLGRVKDDVNQRLMTDHILGRTESASSLAALDLLYGSNTVPSHGLGSLTPGTWYSSDAEPSPCGTPPCFQPYDGSLFRSVNAFRSEVKLSTPLRQYLSNVLGQYTIMLSGAGTAMVMPRHVVFLVDLSGSIVDKSHKRANSLCQPGSSLCDFAMANSYQFTHHTTGSSRIRSVASRFSFENRVIRHLNCNVAGIDFDQYSQSYDKMAWCGMEPTDLTIIDGITRENWSAAGLNEKHYRADYQNLNMPWVSSSGNHMNQILKYDDYSATVSKNVEPLFSVLSGVRNALLTFQSWKTDADLAGLIGFDEEVFDDSSPTRMFSLSNDFAPILKATDVNLPDPQSDNGSWLKKFLFPRSANTDPHPALIKAVSWLNAADTPAQEKKIVIMFTDGMFNCAQVGSVRECNTYDYRYLNWSYENLEYYTLPSLRATGAEVHGFLIGDQVMPNTANYEDPDAPGTCMDPDKGRSLGYSVARGWVGLPSSYPRVVDGIDSWARPNSLLQRFVYLAGGMIHPIRPQGLLPPGPISMNGSGVVEQRRCNVPYTPPGPNPADDWHGASPQLQLTDPQNRTQARQVQDALERIVGEVPVVLVAK